MKTLLLEHNSDNGVSSGGVDLEDGRKLTVSVEQDTFGDSPRDWDNLGTMVCWHNRYRLGDVDGQKEYGDSNAFLEWIQEEEALTLPLYLYDHSGLGMSTSNARYPFSCPWDAGQVGWIYVLLEDVRKEYGDDSKGSKEIAVRCLHSEVLTYDQHLRGEVYGYSIEVVSREKCSQCGHVKERADVQDSCWGFYGDPGGYLLDTVNGIIKEFGVVAELE